MGISYKPLWKLLIDKGMNKGQLSELANISTTSMARMGKDQYVNIEIIERICKALDCKIEEVVQYFPEEEQKK